MTSQLQTPILFLIFNRIDLEQKVFNAIRNVKPRYLYIAADGARKNNDADMVKCQKARAIIDQVDWECKVNTLFQADNLGCGPATLTAISWFFDNVEGGIILEDDDLPNKDFFYFCEVLLDYYKNVPEILNIGGNNFQYGRKRGPDSYYFSKYAHLFGFATWRRACAIILPEANSKPERVKASWDTLWRKIVDKHGLSITPEVNLVTNIGYGHSDATCTTYVQRKDYLRGNVPVCPLSFPLRHPGSVKETKVADNFLRYEYLWHGIDNEIPQAMEDTFLFFMGLLPPFIIGLLRVVKRKWLKWY